MTVIKPGSTIGILGGGQLGRMISIAGRNMGYRFITLDPTPDSPCGQVADRQITAPFSDLTAAKDLADSSDVITYEFENVDSNIASILETTSFVPQGSELLKITQNRIHEKSTLQSYFVPVAPFMEIQSENDIHIAIDRFGLPCVMKTAAGGYDGKGQWVIRSKDHISMAIVAWNKTGVEMIIEKFISFSKELSVIVARNILGQSKTFPIAENIHVNNILHQSIVPARISKEQWAQAETIALKIAESIQAVGLMAIEMFLTNDGEMIVNELAPRPHNSGHFSMDACVTSQFEQHIKAICGLPLGDTSLLSPIIMVNILGQHLSKVLDKIDQLPPTAKLHLYGKKESVENRKMGHINFLGSTHEQVLQQINNLQIWK
ncbi:5-(carboxyamino)imidazole ribonucleotide synthase [Neobacillus ginsengisoli]|uniref:N5-carboxyaminoimidazole ribonucleotide synthase n=1 Tax=Neobacillus ginsengisoli TaxID=904295 RepID=A0ABT9XVB9_9BACI|nr:5-(carboxyamino)imidazole ribonucleotide synthase [Neobacillus ginsengisoli]MDQ0199508.1 5-(carboxyamino)imidazole ribonucleotide synthase [Neobacillus ginsengisoli]